MALTYAVPGLLDIVSEKQLRDLFYKHRVIFDLRFSKSGPFSYKFHDNLTQIS